MILARFSTPIRWLVVALALTICMGCSPSANNASLRAGESPEDIVRQIYTLPDPNFDAFYDPAQRPLYYTGRIVHAAEAKERCFKKQFGMDHLDFDYIVPGQDHDIRDFHLELVENTGSDAKVKVRFQNFPGIELAELMYHLKRVGERWLIDDTVYDGRALSESLMGDC